MINIRRSLRDKEVLRQNHLTDKDHYSKEDLTIKQLYVKNIRKRY